jgi:hypothetical protein
VTPAMPEYEAVAEPEMVTVLVAEPVTGWK